MKKCEFVRKLFQEMLFIFMSRQFCCKFDQHHVAMYPFMTGRLRRNTILNKNHLENNKKKTYIAVFFVKAVPGLIVNRKWLA